MGSLVGLKLVEAVASFIRSSAFTKPIREFVERECLVFEASTSGAPGGGGEGYEHELMDVQEAYASLASDLIEAHLDSVGADWDTLQAACFDHASAPPTAIVRNAIAVCSDFPAFFEMMAAANLELEAKALELWHLQTQFGFDEDDLAAETELADSAMELPDAAALIAEYGLSKETVRELEKARAELGGGEQLVAKLGSLAQAYSGDANPLSAAMAAAELGQDGEEEEEEAQAASLPRTARSPPLPAGAKARRAAPASKPLRTISLDAPQPSMSAPPTVSSLSPRPDAPAIRVTTTDTLTTAATRAAAAVSKGPAKRKGGVPALRKLHVSGPPSPSSVTSPVKSTGSDGMVQSAGKARRIPALSSEGPLSAPAKQSHLAESPRISKPGDPDYDENTTLSIGDSRWKIGRQIGRGATARVFLAVDMDLHRTFAVKQIMCGPNQTAAEIAALAELEREIEVMKRLSHPSLVRYLGTERTDAELYIAMEYVRGGALADLIKRIAAQQARQRMQRQAAEAAAADETRGHALEAAAAAAPAAPQVVLPLRTVASYTAQILGGLAYLHEQGVIHRDIKSANILVDATYQHVKIADFGSARVLEPLAEGGLKSDGAQTLKGTPFWMAPEVIQGTGYGIKADVWSVGCVCIEMLTGRPPWSSQLGGDKAHPYAIMYHIVNAPQPPDFPSGLPPHIDEAMNLMFERDTKKRPSAKQLLDHEWLRNALPAELPEPPPPLRSGQGDLLKEATSEPPSLMTTLASR